MKQRILALSFLAFAFLIASGTSSLAADKLSYTLTVTIAVNTIDIQGPAGDGGWLTFGVVMRGSNSIVQWEMRNIGTATIYLSMSCTASNVNGWTLLETGNPSADDPGNDQYRMSCQYTQWDRVPAPSQADFGSEDVLNSTGAQEACSATVFAYDPEAIQYKGYNIAPGGSRAMHILIEVGNNVSGTAGNVLPQIHINAAI